MPLCSGLTQADPFPERDILAKAGLAVRTQHRKEG